MSSVLNTNLYFSTHTGNYVTSTGYSDYLSFDSNILYGSAVSLGDQQHENNMGVNYCSYRVKRVVLKGIARIQTFYANLGSRLIVVLYKVPVKYEGGLVHPSATTYGFTQLKDYVLYSNPRSVLVWNTYSHLGRLGMEVTPHWYYFDCSLSCDKEFVLGPYDVLACSVLCSPTEVGQQWYRYLDFTCKIFYDLL